MNNQQEINALIVDYLEVRNAILQLDFILSLIQNQIVRLSQMGDNEAQINALIQDAFIIQQVILQLTSILLLIQAEIVRLSSDNSANAA